MNEGVDYRDGRVNRGKGRGRKIGRQGWKSKKGEALVMKQGDFLRGQNLKTSRDCDDKPDSLFNL